MKQEEMNQRLLKEIKMGEWGTSLEKNMENFHHSVSY